MSTQYKFTQIPDQLPYSKYCKAQIATAHSRIIEQVATIFDKSARQRRKIIRLMNVISCIYISNETPPDNWDIHYLLDNLDNISEVSDESLRKCLQNTYIREKDVVFDIEPVADVPARPAETTKSTPAPVAAKRESRKVSITPSEKKRPETNKSDLYIQPPVVPQFNTKEVLARGYVHGSTYCVYSSEPKIPTKQNEISATTDVNLMIDSDFMKLFPTTFIRTRSNQMYLPCEGIELHPELGLILPIDGFTRDQIVDNIVKYPHLFKLMKECDGEVLSFYTTIEIDGELLQISDVWKDLPESSVIPYKSDFVKEYVVRRYLLERDVKGIKHRYSMYGTLDPFLTLFTTADDYIRMGYDDVIDIARKCVNARVSYKRSRNPVLRRLEELE